MKLKLTVLALAAIGFGALNQWVGWGWRHAPNYGPQAQSVVLLPTTLNNLPVSTHWNNQRPTGAIEQGALYSAAGLSADQAQHRGIQLDFYRNNSATHNGIGCYINQGENLLWQRLQPVHFATTAAVVDLALLRTQNHLRLVAATECRAQGCSEQPLPFWNQFWRGLKADFRHSSTGSVVPMSLVLQADIDSSHTLATAQAALLVRFQRAAAQIDLAPAQRLAALQSGHQVAQLADDSPGGVTNVLVENTSTGSTDTGPARSPGSRSEAGASAPSIPGLPMATRATY